MEKLIYDLEGNVIDSEKIAMIPEFLGTIMTYISEHPIKTFLFLFAWQIITLLIVGACVNSRNRKLHLLASFLISFFGGWGGYLYFDHQTDHKDSYLYRHHANRPFFSSVGMIGIGAQTAIWMILFIMAIVAIATSFMDYIMFFMGAALFWVVLMALFPLFAILSFISK